MAISSHQRPSREIDSRSLPEESTKQLRSMAIDGHQQPSKAIEGDRLEIVTWRIHEAVARPQSPRAVPGVALGRDCLGDCPWWRQRLAVPAIRCTQMHSDAIRRDEMQSKGHQRHHQRDHQRRHQRRHQEAIRVLDHVLQPALRCNQMQSKGHQSVLDHVLQPALRCNQMQSDGHQSVLDHVLQPALRVPLHRRPEGLEGNVVEPAEQVAA